MAIFEKDSNITLKDIKIVLDFFKNRFPIVDFIAIKALAYMQMKELAQKKDKSFNEYYRRA